ncbi:MAG: mechanosensitive ion channel [Clostridia bacterium]|nr:mechanosensitive ion channel [Clostridia bacterium]
MSPIITKILEGAVRIGSKLLFAILVLVVGSLLIQLLLRIISKSRAYARIDPEAKSFLNSFIKIALYIVLVIAIVPILGIEIASIITVLATAGAAIGLALQGSLSNLAGGIMLVCLKPFKIGDFIEAGGQSGVVREISIFYTVLTTVDNKRVLIPNGTLMGSTIVDYSTEETRRVDLTFTVAYGTDPDRVTALLLSIAEADARVLTTPAPFSRMTAQNDSSLGFTLRVWVKSDDYWDVYHDTLLKVHNELCAAGIEIPFPQLDVHLRKDN